ARSCAFLHHVAEGRWLHDRRLIDQAIQYWLRAERTVRWRRICLSSARSQIRCGAAMLTLEGLSVPEMTRVRSSLMIDGHHLDSMCSMTSSVPREWLTKGRVRGSYMVSVRSRTRTTWKPSRVICRIPKERLRIQILVWTPISAMLVMPSCLQKL